jgi:hypothetical protein
MHCPLFLPYYEAVIKQRMTRNHDDRGNFNVVVDLFLYIYPLQYIVLFTTNSCKNVILKPFGAPLKAYKSVVILRLPQVFRLHTLNLINVHTRRPCDS